MVGARSWACSGRTVGQQAESRAEQDMHSLGSQELRVTVRRHGRGQEYVMTENLHLIFSDLSVPKKCVCLSAYR